VDWLVYLLIAGIVVLPLIFMMTSAAFANFWPHNLSTYTLVAFGGAWLAALVTLGQVIFNGPFNFTLVSLPQTPLFGFLADRVSVILLLLVITVSGIVHLYSIRAMQEERHFSRYFTLLTMVTLEVLLVVLANNLLMLGIFWILKGFTLTFLLAHYQNRPASWQAAFKKLRADLVGATSFSVALFMTWNLFGTFDIHTINTIATEKPQTLPIEQTTLLTVLLLLAAMVKSAQFPLHGWLPQSVEAPTPVSALMHAGLINAGGFLLIRLSPLFVATPLTLVLAVVIGGFTAIYATTIMRTRSDVKGMLVYSTMGQMGFMLLECGLGAFGLAMLHIVAHGLYKATLFLGAGNIIQQKALDQHLIPAHKNTSQLPVIRVIGVVVLALLLLALPPALGFSVNSSTILLAFAWITLIYSVPALKKLSPIKFFAGISGLIVLYVIGIHTIEGFFKQAVAANPALDAALVYAICGILILIGTVAIVFQSSHKPVWINKFFTTIYVRTLFIGYNGK